LVLITAVGRHAESKTNDTSVISLITL
jgi:hypothetical protein